MKVYRMQRGVYQVRRQRRDPIDALDRAKELILKSAFLDGELKTVEKVTSLKQERNVLGRKRPPLVTLEITLDRSSRTWLDVRAAHIEQALRDGGLKVR